MVFQAIELDVVSEVAKNTWILLVLHRIHFEALREWRRWMNLLGESRQNEILELNGMVGQSVDEVEMEVTQELRIVLQDDKNDIHRRSVEGAHSSRGWLSWDEVDLDESEALHQ